MCSPSSAKACSARAEWTPAPQATTALRPARASSSVRPLQPELTVRRACHAWSEAIDWTQDERLPVPVDASKVAANFKNGVLTITLPKAAAAKGTAIPVKTE